MKYAILDTYLASLHNEYPPREETVAEIQDREQGDLLCYANPEHAKRIIESVNALAGIPDPSAALKAAREALEEWTQEPVDCSSTRNPAPYPDCTCWACDRTRRSLAALAALKGEQP